MKIRYAGMKLQKPIRLPNGEETEERWVYAPIELESVNLLGGHRLGWVVPVSALGDAEDSEDGS